MSIDPVPESSYGHSHGHPSEEKDIKEEEWDPTVQDAFGNEETAEVKYKVLKWWYVSHIPHIPHTIRVAMILSTDPTGNVVYVCTSPV